jgi:hypothetical protein
LLRAGWGACNLSVKPDIDIPPGVQYRAAVAPD